MSEAKRDQSAFQQSASEGRAIGPSRRYGLAACAGPKFAELRVLESWETKLMPSGDPYNGTGARVGFSQGLRK